MSEYWTYARIKEKVEEDLDLQDEVFISDPEFMKYANEAIRQAEAEVHAVYEDYFLKRIPLTFVTGQEEYTLPADLYAHKIRRIVYKNGSKVYTINRLRDWRKFEEYAIESINKSSTVYEYFIINQTAGSPTLLLSPPAKEDGAFATIWYLRKANEITSDTSICDIPEFINYILQYIKVRCYEKEVGHPALEKSIADLAQQRELMVSTLATMVPDADNGIEPDLTTYEEMS